MGGDDKRKENNFAVLQNPNTFCWLIHCPQVKFGKWDNRQEDIEEICTCLFDWVYKETALSAEFFKRVCVHTPCIMVLLKYFEKISHILISK